MRKFWAILCIMALVFTAMSPAGPVFAATATDAGDFDGDTGDNPWEDLFTTTAEENETTEEVTTEEITTPEPTTEEEVTTPEPTTVEETTTEEITAPEPTTVEETTKEEVTTEEETTAEAKSITIISQPKNVIAPVKSKVEFSVEAEGEGLTYQWQVNSSGVWKDTSITGNKTDTISFVIPETYSVKVYRCVIKDANGNEAITDEAVLTVGEEPTVPSDKIVIVSQPKDVTAPVGSKVEFNVVAEGEGLTYQWQVNSSGEWKATSITGNKTNTISFVIPATYSVKVYRCVIKDADGNEAITDEVVLIVGEEPTVPSDKIVIVSQPKDVTAPVGSKVEFNVVAEGEGLTYQWQVNSSGEWKATSITGNKTNTISFVIPVTYSIKVYRCVIKDSKGNTVVSNPATLTVGQSENTIVVKEQPKNQTLPVGEKVEFSVVAEGEGLTYQWQVNSSGVWKDTSITGNKTNTLSFVIPATYSVKVYRCVIRDANGSEMISNEATLTVGVPQPGNISIISQPKDVTISAGEMVQFSVEAEGEGLTYQWQVSNDGITWKDTSIAGNETAEISFKVPTNYTIKMYRCIVTDVNGEYTISDVGTLVVKK